MDDSSFQWVGRRLCECGVLLAAVLKSGLVATAATASPRVSSSARVLKLRSYTHMRNLGHAVFFGRPQRAQERARLKKVLRRRPKLAELRRGAPGKVQLRWRTGSMPAAGHGAGVSGLTDPSLKALRTLAGSLVGAKRS
eukprot:9369224-Pyramimonas_sp.AAC.1